MPIRLLIILQLPPPVHGASLMNAYLLDVLRQSSLEWEYLSFRDVQELNRVGRFAVKKIVSSCIVLFQMLARRKRYSHFMLSLSTRGYALVRDYILVVWARILGKRIVLLLRGKGFGQKKGLQARMIVRIFRDSSVIQHTDLLLPDICHLPYREVFFLANGLPDQYSALTNETKGGQAVESAPVQIVFLSNLMEAKGLFVLIEALHQLVLKGLSFTCHFIGAWTNCHTELRFRRLVKDRRLEHVIGEVGPRYGDEKFAFLSRMDLLVFPTLNEAFGNVAVEAMMCAKPVVASREGSLPTIIEDGKTGLLVETGLADPLARALENLICNPELRLSMGQNGRRRYLERFSMDHYRGQALAIFSEILSS